MHDPMSVAFEIRFPLKRKPKNNFELRAYGKGWQKDRRIVPRSAIVTIWHVDPECDGSDDSCDWFHRKKYFPYFHDRLKELPPNFIELFWLIEDACAPKRAWWKHPRWHIWHWKLQIPLLQDVKRWAFSRCAGCKKHFAFGYSPVTTQWHGGGPRWFHGEPHTYHDKCCPPCVQPNQNVAGSNEVNA